jgi:hypothetical protein
MSLFEFAVVLWCAVPVLSLGSVGLTATIRAFATAPQLARRPLSCQLCMSAWCSWALCWGAWAVARYVLGVPWLEATALSFAAQPGSIGLALLLLRFEEHAEVLAARSDTSIPDVLSPGP